MQRRAPILHLRNGGTSVVLDLTAPGLPAIVHWGEDLGPLDDAHLTAVATATLAQRVSGGLDDPVRLSLLPQESFGWLGSPGLVGSRAGRAFSPRFATSHSAASLTGVAIDAIDKDADLGLRIDLELDDAGVLSQRLTLTNRGADAYGIGSLSATFPLPASATEILDTTGRHLREHSPQRYPLTVGTHARYSRGGRPGAGSTLFVAAGVSGFGFERGLVHAIHLAWSGNTHVAAERAIESIALLQASEQLASGEIVLEAGASYSTPIVYGSWGWGLNEVSARFHESVRSRRPAPLRPRPVTLNTWEAVYFDHDLAALISLARIGAKIGIERFVLDDGWFRGRRDDSAGLGDWYVDEEVWPDGLGPLADHIVDLGMEFGLWFEPEMVNPDSDLARAHPEWILQAGDRMPAVGRQQQVLDLSHPDAYAYIRERMHAILSAYPISYVKWDHNRDLVDAGSTITGRAAVHANVIALYSLFDELKALHPGLEIESCASGGARVDLGILAHTDRIWTSDTTDPLERLTIQRYTGVVVPNELMGMHVGNPVSHTTGRSSRLSLRAAVALFGHFGVEADLRKFEEHELAQLAEWIAYYRSKRALFATGASVHGDTVDSALDLRGVVAADQSEAVFLLTQTVSTAGYPPAAITFPGLDDDGTYRVEVVLGHLSDPERGQSPLPWTDEPLLLTGQVLRAIGLRAPVRGPESVTVIEITAASSGG